MEKGGQFSSGPGLVVGEVAKEQADQTIIQG
jgi:hypothetical protein